MRGAIVLSLAIGIGVNTAVFSALNALLFRPLALRDLDRAVVVYHASPDNPDRGTSFPATLLSRSQPYRHRSPATFVTPIVRATPLTLFIMGEVMTAGL